MLNKLKKCDKSFSPSSPEKQIDQTTKPPKYLDVASETGEKLHILQKANPATSRPAPHNETVTRCDLHLTPVMEYHPVKPTFGMQPSLGRVQHANISPMPAKFEAVRTKTLADEKNLQSQRKSIDVELHRFTRYEKALPPSPSDQQNVILCSTLDSNANLKQVHKKSKPIRYLDGTSTTADLPKHDAWDQ